MRTRILEPEPRQSTAGRFRHLVDWQQEAFLGEEVDENQKSDVSELVAAAFDAKLEAERTGSRLIRPEHHMEVPLKYRK